MSAYVDVKGRRKKFRGGELEGPEEPIGKPQFGRNTTTEEERADEEEEDELEMLRKMFNSDDWDWGEKISVLRGKWGEEGNLGDYDELANCATLAHSLLLLAGNLEGKVRQVERENKAFAGKTKEIHSTIEALLRVGKRMAKFVRVEVQCVIFKGMGRLSRCEGLFINKSVGDSTVRVAEVSELCDWVVRGSEVVGGVAGGRFENWSFGGVQVLLGKMVLR